MGERSCERCQSFYWMQIPDEDGELLGEDPACDEGHQDIAGLFGHDPTVDCSDFKPRPEVEKP